MEIEIKRTEVFVVDYTEQDSYGNLKVFDKGGKTYKVNAKHGDIQHVFADGMAVEVGWAEFNINGKQGEYIHEARQVKDALPIGNAATKIESPQTDTPVATPKSPTDKDKAIEEQVRRKEQGADYRSGLLEKFPQECADYINWRSGGTSIGWPQTWADMLTPISDENRAKLFNSVQKKVQELTKPEEI